MNSARQKDMSASARGRGGALVGREGELGRYLMTAGRPDRMSNLAGDDTIAGGGDTPLLTRHVRLSVNKRPGRGGPSRPIPD